MYMYVVIENGDPYPNAYSSFASAIVAVKEKYEGIEVHDLDSSDDTSGKIYVYIEKGIHIYIHKLPVLSF